MTWEQILPQNAALESYRSVEHHLDIAAGTSAFSYVLGTVRRDGQLRGIGGIAYSSSGTEQGRMPARRVLVDQAENVINW